MSIPLKSGMIGRADLPLSSMGVGYKDRFAVLAYNRGEWMDIYAGCAKGGQIVVPLMFRLAPPDIEYNKRQAARTEK